MDVEVGDIYIRNLDKRVYKVKKIDNKMVVLQVMNERQLSLINIFGLEKAYTKIKPKSA